MQDKFKTHGAFSWCELVTTDPDAATEFYAELFGWSVEKMPMTHMEMTYAVLKSGEEGIGGIMPTPPTAEGMPPQWGVYITVDDVDATAKRAEELGAKMIMPLTDIPDVGRMCVLQDPQGASISIITYVDMD